MYWLLKTEPSTFSWDDLEKDFKKKGYSEWDGVRNFEARNNMKKMNKGDSVFIYHSVHKPEIVGIAKVVAVAHLDSTDKSGVWWCVDVAPVKKLTQPVTLEEIKTIPACREMVLLRRGRLSVSPVSEGEWKAIVSRF